MRLDDLDRRIAAILARDGRRSFREIAKEVSSTTPTVAARVRALEDIGIVRGYHARIDAAALGAREYILQVTARPDAASDVAERLVRLEGTTSARLLPGGRIVAHVAMPPGRGLQEVHAAVASLPGLVDYDAHEVLATHRRDAAADLPLELDVPCHQCHGPIHGVPVRARHGDRAHVFCCRQCAATFRGRFEAAESRGVAALAERQPPST